VTVASLVGQRLPDLLLPATSGDQVNLSKHKGRMVVFLYPYTGKPGTPDPEGWDSIAGAHGSTPQALGFSMLYDEFQKLDMKVFGISFQASAWQAEFVKRNALRFALLSDEQRQFSSALRLETFKAGHQDFLCRRTFVVSNGIVRQDFYLVRDPASNAAEILMATQT
jgi:peroxiredoxin